MYVPLNVQNTSSAILKGRVSLAEVELRKTPGGAFYETVLLHLDLHVYFGVKNYWALCY